MSPRGDRATRCSFLYPPQDQRKGERSFWRCKTRSKGDRPHHPKKAAQPKPSEPPSHSQQTKTSPGMSKAASMRKSHSSRTGGKQQDEPQAHPSFEPGYYDHSFNSLATLVKQCPWILGADASPSLASSDAEFYPPVPRSLKHDSAVSFVVTDHIRPEQPSFIISCPLEHVDYIQNLLSPDGSARCLKARGSSGHPREGDQLRSMLLDGTPNIELSLHAGTEAGPKTSPSRGRGSGCGPGSINGGGGHSPGLGQEHLNDGYHGPTAYSFTGQHPFTHLNSGAAGAPHWARSHHTFVPATCMPMPPPGCFGCQRDDVGGLQMPYPVPPFTDHHAQPAAFDGAPQQN